MGAMQKYILSIISAAALCALLIALVPKGQAKEAVRMICGVFLLISVLSPLTSRSISEMETILSSFYIDSDQYVLSGKEMSIQAAAQFIKAKSEAYILDKAEALNTALSIEIQLNDEDLPYSARLQGDITPESQSLLEAILESDLGITKERQEWIVSSGRNS